MVKKIKFEIINGKGAVIMTTEHISCIPDSDKLHYMSKAGYKFRIDGKNASVKRINEAVSAEQT